MQEEKTAANDMTGPNSKEAFKKQSRSKKVLRLIMSIQGLEREQSGE